MSGSRKNASNGGVDKSYPKRLKEKYGDYSKRKSTIVGRNMITNSLNKTAFAEAVVSVKTSQNSEHEMGSESDSDSDQPLSSSLSTTQPLQQSKGIPTPDTSVMGDKPERLEKRVEPQSTFEFLEAFYTGRVKSLSESVVRRLKTNGIALDVQSRGVLLRLAQAEDETLDKTRRLMLIASDENDLKPLGHLLLEFSVEVVCLHKSIQSNGMKAKLFPNYHDESTLEQAWESLNANKPHKEPVHSIEQAAFHNSEDHEARIESAVGPDRRERGSAIANSKAKASSLATKARRNAFLGSVIWRIQKKHATFAEAMRAMRNTIFRTPTALGLESDLLEAIALMPDKEDSRVALLLEWQAKQQLDVTSKLTDANNLAARLTAQLEQMEQEKSTYLETISSLQKDLLVVQIEGRNLQAQIGVVKTHGNADHEALRSLSLRVVRDTVRQLESVSTALGREPPKVAIAVEVLNTVSDGLRQSEVKLGET